MTGWDQLNILRAKISCALQTVRLLYTGVFSTSAAISRLLLLTQNIAIESFALLALLSEQCSSCSSGLGYIHPIRHIALNVPSYSQLFRHIADPKQSSRELVESQ